MKNDVTEQFFCQSAGLLFITGGLCLNTKSRTKRFYWYQKWNVNLACYFRTFITPPVFKYCRNFSFEMYILLKIGCYNDMNYFN